MSSTILVTDDTAFIRRSIRHILARGGFHCVVEASNGYEAVDQYEKHKPVIVFMDIRMPIMDGITAVKEICTKDPEAKIIVCSAEGCRETVLSAVEAGAKDYIVLPFKAERILDSVNRLIAQGAA